MYDTIIIKGQIKCTETEKEALFQQFCMNNINATNENRNNAGYQKNENCKGLYLSYESQINTLKIQFSIHKYFSFINNLGFINYNDFNFADAKSTYKNLQEFMPIDINSFVVTFYEAGVNVAVPGTLQEYFETLQSVNYGNRKMKILESFRHKEYTLYSTNMSENKRSSYVFYDKAVESKNQDIAGTMRIEKKYLRQNTEITINQLFTDKFMKKVEKEINTTFVQKLEYKVNVIHSKHNASDREALAMIEKHGSVGVYAEIERMRKNAEITRLQLHRYKEKIKKLLSTEEKNQVKISQKSDIMRQKIAEKLKKISIY